VTARYDSGAMFLVGCWCVFGYAGSG
jgi:hypothetical protein